MTSVSIREVRKSYGATAVLHGVSVDVQDGEFVILVGPSGCGKSTLLRMIAGLEDISEGDIRIGSRVVNDVPPKDRDIAMVFQNYALYPHMTVSDDMAFSLKLKKASKGEIASKVGRAADILGLSPLLIAIRANSRVDSVSGLPWGAPSCVTPKYSFLTNHCRTWMRSCVFRCGPR
ncbi:MAG: sugar transporter ATP-binding protein [Microvirga sp.]|jgi:multiple sugar transport system ATP-binding protein|nr:sugar transporter ATP-binding protein [Microvirga sp.]